VPKPTPSVTPPVVQGNTLPIDSNLLFVLDDAISSASSHAGETVRAHLKDPIVLNGRTVVAAGTPERIKILDVSHSAIGDVYGFVDIYFEPLDLGNGVKLPLRAPDSRLEPHVSAGHESTVETEDTIGSMVIPYYLLYAIFRKGKNFVLKPGSVLIARTQADLVAAPDGAVAVQPPEPLARSQLIPDATFPVEPFATPFGPDARIPRPQTPLPSPTPSPAPSPARTRGSAAPSRSS
jgi:hypothetical protein